MIARTFQHIQSDSNHLLFGINQLNPDSSNSLQVLSFLFTPAMGIPGRLNSEDAANNVQSCCTCKIRAHNLSRAHSQQLLILKIKESYWLELKTQSPSLSVDELKLSEPSTDSQNIILHQWPASIGLISYSNLFSQFHACCKPRAKLAVDVFGTTKRWMALLWHSRLYGMLRNNKTNLHWNGLRHCTQHLEIYEHLIHLYISYAYYILSSSMLGCSPGGSHFLSAVNEKQCQNLGSEPKEKRWSPPSSKGGIDCLWNQRP